jgi:hypothetical protein
MVPSVSNKQKNGGEILYIFLTSWKLGSKVLKKNTGSGSVIFGMDQRIWISIKTSQIRNTGTLQSTNPACLALSVETHNSETQKGSADDL